jgi:hypothetical protein
LEGTYFFGSQITEVTSPSIAPATYFIYRRYKADIDCQTHGKYTPLHRCAYYNHARLASLLVLAGADQTIVDENGQTAYEVAVQAENEDIAQILQPIFDAEGRNISGLPYATNNPKHPNFRPEARESLFALHEMEESWEDASDSEGDEGEEETGNGETNN